MKVLLVDDHPLFLEGLRNLLSARGIDVSGAARDGLDAVERARALRPDLILMDIQMPRLDGLAAIRRIKSELPDTRVVVLTMSADDKDLLEAVRSGACGYLLKSDEPEAFFALLRNVERGEVALSRSLAAKRSDESREGATDAASEAPEALSPREVEVLALVTEGLTYKQIGEKLFVSERTVKYHMAEIISRLHVNGRLDAIEYARRTGLTR
jgi:DNA-binding NarL/FixJ family response regulator